MGAPQPQGGGLFGSTNTGTTGFGATAQPTAGGFGGFGQPQQQQQQIGLFGANQNQVERDCCFNLVEQLAAIKGWEEEITVKNWIFFVKIEKRFLFLCCFLL